SVAESRGNIVANDNSINRVVLVVCQGQCILNPDSCTVCITIKCVVLNGNSVRYCRAARRLSRSPQRVYKHMGEVAGTRSMEPVVCQRSGSGTAGEYTNLVSRNMEIIVRDLNRCIFVVVVIPQSTHSERRRRLERVAQNLD